MPVKKVPVVREVVLKINGRRYGVGAARHAAEAWANMVVWRMYYNKKVKFHSPKWERHYASAVRRSLPIFQKHLLK